MKRLKEPFIALAIFAGLASNLPSLAGCGEGEGRMLICHYGQCQEKRVGNQCSDTTGFSFLERDYWGRDDSKSTGYAFDFTSIYQGRPLQLRVTKDNRQLYYGAPKDSPWQIGVCEVFPYQLQSCGRGFVNPADHQSLPRT